MGSLKCESAFLESSGTVVQTPFFINKEEHQNKKLTPTAPKNNTCPAFLKRILIWKKINANLVEQVKQVLFLAARRCA